MRLEAKMNETFTERYMTCGAVWRFSFPFLYFIRLIYTDRNMIVTNKQISLHHQNILRLVSNVEWLQRVPGYKDGFPLYIFTPSPSILNCTYSHPNFMKFSLALLSIHLVSCLKSKHTRVRILCLVVLRVVLVIAFTFSPWNFGKYRDLWLVLLHSMNTDWVVGTLKPYLLYSSLFELFALTGSETLKYLPQLLAPEPPGETFTA